MNPRFPVFYIVMTISLMLGCTSTGAPSSTNEASVAPKSGTTSTPDLAPAVTTGAEVNNSSTSSASPVEDEIAGCETSWKREARLKALNTAVEKSDLETQSVKDGFANSSQRNRLAILSAGLIPDDVPFVSLDRSCWSEFYRAHQNLRDGKEGLAKKAAEGWRVCLTANFPDRSIQARKLYRCFGLSPSTEADPSIDRAEDSSND